MTAFTMQRARRDAQIVAWQERIPVARARPGWRQRAACLGLNTNLMYQDERGATHARQTCNTCPERLSCLATARDEEHHDLDCIYGIRGGLTPDERRTAYRETR